MKLLTTSLLAGLCLLFTACGPSGPSEADSAAEAEAIRLEVLSQEIDSSAEKVETTAEELMEALDSLDILFPEEQ